MKKLFLILILFWTNCFGMKKSELEKRFDDLAFITVNTQDTFGNTSLHYAVLLNDVNKVRNELYVGNSPNIKNNNGQIPLHLACQAKPLNKTIIDLLLHDKANPNVPDKMGNTPLHFCAYNVSGKEHKRNIIRKLFKYGADANIQNKQGYTPLHTVVSRGTGEKGGDKYLIRILLNRGANPLIKSNDIKTRQSKIISKGKTALALAENIRKTYKKGSKKYLIWDEIVQDLTTAAKKFKVQPKKRKKEPNILAEILNDLSIQMNNLAKAIAA